MTENLFPGVYVEEFDSDIEPMKGVTTCTVGFIGMTQRGKVTGAPEFIKSYGEFQKKFGTYLHKEVYGERRYLPMAVEQFFVNGGTHCYVVRLLNEKNAATASKTVAGITFCANSPGVWGNDVTVSVSTSPMGENLYNFQVVCLDSKGKPIQQETFQDVSLDPASNSYICRTFEKSLLVTVGCLTALTENGGDSSQQQKGGEPPGSDDDTLFKGNEIELEKRGILAAFISFLLQLIRPGAKEKPVQPEVVAESPHNPQPIALQQSVDDLLMEFIKADPKGNPMFRMEGGYDYKEEAALSENVDAALFKGNDGEPGKRSGLAAFQDISDVSILVAPGVTDMSEVAEIVTHCERMGNCVCILDMPSDESNVKALQEYCAQVDSSYAAMYHPWIQVFDPLEKKPVFMPPSGSIAGVYARTDNAHGVYKAPANESIRNCTGLQIPFRKLEQDILISVGINLICNIQGQGIKVWGARTCSNDPGWKYINVRRLFIYIEESIRRGTCWAVFERNDVLLWTKISGSITAFLRAMWRDGALVGALEGEAFFVKIGKGSTMTDHGRFINRKHVNNEVIYHTIFQVKNNVRILIRNNKGCDLMIFTRYLIYETTVHDRR